MPRVKLEADEMALTGCAADYPWRLLTSGCEGSGVGQGSWSPTRQRQGLQR